MRSYKGTISSNLQSQRTSVPKKEILQRIKSKKEVKSYQLGHQPSLTWSTGAGPRIACVADYPQNLRVQALQYVDLSPRASPRPSDFNIPTDLTPLSKICNIMWSHFRSPFNHSNLSVLPQPACQPSLVHILLVEAFSNLKTSNKKILNLFLKISPETPFRKCIFHTLSIMY